MGEDTKCDEGTLKLALPTVFVPMGGMVQIVGQKGAQLSPSEGGQTYIVQSWETHCILVVLPAGVPSVMVSSSSSSFSQAVLQTSEKEESPEESKVEGKGMNPDISCLVGLMPVGVREGGCSPLFCPQTCGGGWEGLEI